MLDCIPFEMLCLPPAYAQVASYLGDGGPVDAKGKPVSFTQADLLRAGAQIQIVLSVAPEKPPASFYTKFRAGGSVIYYSRYCEALHCGFELSVVDQGRRSGGRAMRRRQSCGLGRRCRCRGPAPRAWRNSYPRRDGSFR